MALGRVRTERLAVGDGETMAGAGIYLRAERHAGLAQRRLEPFDHLGRDRRVLVRMAEIQTRLDPVRPAMGTLGSVGGQAAAVEGSRRDDKLGKIGGGGECEGAGQAIADDAQPGGTDMAAARSACTASGVRVARNSCRRARVASSPNGILGSRTGARPAR